MHKHIQQMQDVHPFDIFVEILIPQFAEMENAHPSNSFADPCIQCSGLAGFPKGLQFDTKVDANWQPEGAQNRPKTGPKIDFFEVPRNSPEKSHILSFFALTFQNVDVPQTYHLPYPNYIFKCSVHNQK